MPDRRRTTPARPLVASAQVVSEQKVVDRHLFQYDSWQDEVWAYWRSLGPLNYGITWQSNALSRVRLIAAELVPGGDEPAPLTEGAAADLMEQFAGGLPGQAAVMKALGTQLGVPGEGWLVAQRPTASVPLNQADWKVLSTTAVRPSRSQGADYEIQVEEGRWQPLPPESLVTRIYEPDPQYPWRATSSAQAALATLRRIDLLERRIVATLVSRLAMNGLLLIPQEGTISTPAQYADSADPFTQMLIDVAANNIKNPGNASASIPIPIRFTSEFIEKWRHLTFGDGIAEELLDARDREIRILATTLNMPSEVLLGLGKATHWNAWQIEESGIKLHISPAAETIVTGLTTGYLHPLLVASGEDLVGPNGGKVVVWYDTSELTARPDKSAQATQAYDRVEISGEAYRREVGFAEADKPDASEVREQVLKKLVALPATALQALAELVGPLESSGSGGSPGGGGAESAPPSSPPPDPEPSTGTPATRDEQPTQPSAMPETVAAAAARLLAGVDLPVMRFPAGSLRSPPARVRASNGSRRTRDGPEGM